MKSSMKKRRFSGLRKQPSASFADAVIPPDDTFDDGASIATDNAATAPLLGIAASSPPRKTRSPFNSQTPFKLKSGEKMSFKIGKHKPESSDASGAASRRKRWKSSAKIGKIPSKVNLRSNSRSYDSFASSRGTSSPPPEHVEKLGPAPQKFMEYTFDFDACFLQEPIIYHSLMSDEEPFLRSSTTSSETPPPPPPPPIEQFFVPAFHPFPRLDGAMDDASHESDDREVEENHNLSDSEHLMSASERIKFFESRGPTSLTVPSSSSFKSLSCEAIEQNEYNNACSYSSMPPINEDDFVLSIDDVSSHDMNFEPEFANVKNASSSVIALTLLGAVMGSPAPQTVLKAKKRNDCANLWIDETNDSCDINELPAIENDELAVGSSMPDIDNILPPVQEEVSDDIISIPDEFDDITVEEDSAIDEYAASNTLAWSALAILLGSPAPSCVQQKNNNNAKAKNLWAEGSINENDELVSLATSEINEVADDCSLPTLDENDEIGGDISISGFESDSDNASIQRSNKDAADSAIMWTALSAILASPAPSCVRPMKEKCTKNNLWDDCDDDLISLDNSISIIDETEWITESPNPTFHNNDEDSLGDINLSLSALQLESDNTKELNTDVAPPKTTEEIANSTLAWGALTALLGLPAPSCVVSKNSRPTKNLWSNDDDDDDLLSLADSEADLASVPSLVADSQFDSAPSSPLIQNASTFDVPLPERDNAAIQNYIEWRN